MLCKGAAPEVEMKFYQFILAVILLALSQSCSKPKAAAPVNPPIALEQQHSATHRVGVYEQFEEDDTDPFDESGHCSGTAVARNAILTAQHCFKDSNQIRIDDNAYSTTIMAAFIDGNDHVIYIVDYAFSHWASINQRSLIDGEHVHFWGAPGKNTDVFRTGYFVWLAPEAKLDKKFLFQQFILPTFEGDSGSGIFDENGDVVAVISYADRSANELSEPLRFTDAQLSLLEE